MPKKKLRKSDVFQSVTDATAECVCFLTTEDDELSFRNYEKLEKSEPRINTVKTGMGVSADSLSPPRCSTGRDADSHRFKGSLARYAGGEKLFLFSPNKTTIFSIAF